MTREQKNQEIANLAETLSSNGIIYLADISELDSSNTSKLRRMCFKKEVQLKMVKNTLLAKAIEKVEDKNFGEIPTVLKGSTSLMISETGNVPAKLIKEFRKKEEKPLLKAAYIDESVYIGDDQLEMLASLKSKDELIAEVVSILQSPAKTVISQLQSGKDKLSGVVKALADREE